jgi:hypothetical protein
VRTALEINLQYTNTRQVTTNLTASQIVIHNHYAKTIRNPITIRMMLAIAAVMIITVVKMTTTTRYTARTQATNDNQRH